MNNSRSESSDLSCRQLVSQPSLQPIELTMDWPCYLGSSPSYLNWFYYAPANWSSVPWWINVLGVRCLLALLVETYQHHQKTERKVVAEASITKEGWIMHVPARKPCRRFL